LSEEKVNPRVPAAGIHHHRGRAVGGVVVHDEDGEIILDREGEDIGSGRRCFSARCKSGS